MPLQFKMKPIFAFYTGIYFLQTLKIENFFNFNKKCKFIVSAFSYFNAVDMKVVLSTDTTVVYREYSL